MEQISYRNRPVSPAKLWLRKVMYAENRIERLIERKERYKDMCIRATGRFEATRVSGTDRHDGMANGVVSMMDVDRDLDRELETFARLVTERRAAIAKVEDERMQVILEMRYFDYYEWGKIAERMNFELRWLYHLHGKALRAIERIARL